VGVSIGIAVYPTHGLDVDSLLSAADKAMYSVKRTGKNNFAFSSGLA
jgi:diguanylate cyclase (GGDEF)-like protein